MEHTKTCPEGHLRTHHRLLQPPAPPLSTGLEKLGRLRTEGAYKSIGGGIKPRQSQVEQMKLSFEIAAPTGAGQFLKR